MVDAITRIKCGQIFILPNSDFNLICEFCGRDGFYTLDIFRSHIKYHSEEEVCISSDSDCEYVSTVIPEVVPSASTLQNASPSTAAVENLIESEQIISSSKKSIHKKHILTIPSTNVIVKDGSQSARICTEQCVCAHDIRTEEPGSIPKEIHSKRTKNGYECKICHKLLPSKASTRNRPYKCQICSKTFTARNSLRNHTKLLHTKDLRHACSLCDSIFLFPYQLEAHIREKHLPDTDPRRYFLCNLCFNKFKSFCVWKCHKPCNIRDLE